MVFMYCKKCGKELKESNKFCNNCGTKVTPSNENNIEKDHEKSKVKKIYCRNCGKKIPKDSNTCPQCGFHLNNITPQSDPNNDIIENIFIYGASLFIPFVGIVIWLASKNDNPNRAHTSLILSLIVTSITVITFILFLVLIFFFLISDIGGM